MATRKTAAQKAAEAAQREAETTYPEAAAPQSTDTHLTEVRDDKGKQLTVQQLKNKLRNEAEREVLDTHKDEVIKITAAKYKVHNLDYVRRLTEEEKAAKAIEEYYAKFPNLRPVTVVQADPAPVPAVPGGPLETFRSGGWDEQAEEPDNYRDIEHREGE
jgi:hypothetical protein